MMPKANISASQKEEIVRLIRQNHDIFDVPNRKLPCLVGVKQTIQLVPDAVPYKEPLRKITEAQRVVVEEYLDKLESNGIIRRAATPWQAQLLLVRKPDQTWRVTCDLRGLNKQSLKMC